MSPIQCVLILGYTAMLVSTAMVKPLPIALSNLRSEGTNSLVSIGTVAGKEYFINNYAGPKSWNDNKNICATNQKKMITIETEEVRSFLADRLTDGWYWTAARINADIKDQFFWDTTGRPVTHFNSTNFVFPAYNFLCLVINGYKNNDHMLVTPCGTDNMGNFYVACESY